MPRRPPALPLAAALPALVLTSLAGAAPAPVPPPAITRALEAHVRAFNPPAPRTAARALFEFTLEAAAWHWQPARVEQALALAATMQDREPASPTFGNFRWYHENERPQDLNAVQFCMQRGVLAWNLHRDRLTPAARDQLRQLLELGLEGATRQRVSESYTNIWLMKTWNLIALGEALDRPAAAATGYEMLDRWFLRVDEEGIQEYLSHTYYAVDLECLGLIARFAGRDDGRRAAHTGLRLLWTDLAANWTPAGRLGGARARDYDYLRGSGGIDAILARHGWLPDPTEPDTFARLADTPPPAGLNPTTFPVPRTVVRRFGPAPWQSAVHHLGRTFSIGAAAAGTGPEDKPLAIDLGADRRLPLIRFFLDARNDPYGQLKEPVGRSGHQKALHPNPFLTSVQRGPTALLLAAADPADPRHFSHVPQPRCLLSHLFFPNSLELWLGDARITRPAAGTLPVPPGTPLFLRHQTTAAAIQLPLALDTSGQPAPATLHWDGDRHHAARLTVTHSATPPAGRAAVALWARVAEDLDEPAFARFRQQVLTKPAAAARDGDVVTVRAPGPADELLLRADLAKGLRLDATGGEPGAGTQLMAVNGHDHFHEILAEVPAVARRRQLVADARTGGPAAPRPGIVIEAESAHHFTDGFTTAADPLARGGRFAWPPGDPGTRGPAAGSARWFIHNPADTPLYLWARVLTPTPDDDSFTAAIQPLDRPPQPAADWHTGVHTGWTWVQLRGRTGPLALPSAKGANLLELRARENGARLDALFLTPEAGAAPPADR